MGVSLAALGSACCGLRYRFGATLRSALLTHPPHASRKQYSDVLPCFYAYSCFTLFDIHYQILTRLSSSTLFELHSFYLVFYSFSSRYRIKP
ncbi:MAG: hypothetical protein NZ455_14055 [Bacteroidia bacterium]|nr:hypothetical protein [Bacteroidia bacterium]MDW8346702.1 hypothetical protein [Bacteroidia bacterium]